MKVAEICGRIKNEPCSINWLNEDHLARLIKAASDRNMKSGNMVKFSGRTLFVGDIHADIDSMLSAFEIADEKKAKILFLGDVVDRGSRELECVNLLMARAFLEPERVFYIRGNHEFAEINRKWGFAEAVNERYNETIYSSYNALFSTLPLAAVMNGNILAVHGGIGSETPTLASIEQLDRATLPCKDERAAFLWNDPSEEAGGFDSNNKRGVFYRYGRDAFDNFMSRNNLDLMIRAHEVWPEGCKYFFDKRLISIFSSTDHYKDVKPKAVLVGDDGEHEILSL